MITYYINYDLRKATDRDYEGLYNALNKLGAKRSLESLWWINHPNTTAGNIFDYLRPHLDANDGLVVIASNGWKSYGTKTTPKDL